MPNHPTLRLRSADGLLAVLFLGTLWGAIEALLGGALHRLLPPTYPGRIMLAVAMALLAYSVRKTGSPWVALGMGVVAAPLKLVAAVVYGLPFTAPEVLNPALAMLAEGAAFAALAVPFWRAEQPRRLVGIAAGAAMLQWLVWLGLVRWVAWGLYPPAEVLSALGAKLAPAWAASLPAIAAAALRALPLDLVAGIVGGAAVAAAPTPPGFAARRPVMAAGTLVCLAICFAASWML